ncbi:MAG TPA: hypothetical protein VM124_01170 [Candidatus Limnocylindrales bacterium]|nr:hypothetical protein [Candidatus Limnocylindrales bacterium]
MSELYTPSEIDKRLAENAYLNFATGVAMLRDPDNEVNLAINANESIYSDLEAVVFRAEVLMWEGIRKVVRLAHPRDIRSNLAKVEKQFEAALPHMMDTVDRVSESRAHSLHRLDPAFEFVLPQPITDETVYKYICHPHLEKLLTARLLDGLVAAPIFEDILRGRNMSQVSPVRARTQPSP